MIRYPMAYQPPYQVAHISQAEKGQTYLCLGCDEEMIPRQGKIKRHHFAHKAGMERCDPDNTLHETAKAAICQGFLLAQERGEDYLIEFPCERCREQISTNVALLRAGIATERAAVDGTRSDLVITKEDGKSPRIIIEIVVHHDIEEGTEQRYRDAGIPVVRVRPTWESVDELRQELEVSEILNIPDPTCRQCKESQRKQDEWRGGIEQKVRAKIAPVKTDRPKLETIKQDKFGSFLRFDTRRIVNENAEKLAGIGFAQRPSRSTLFNARVEKWSIFADLDSTDVMKIWEVDGTPGLYAFPEDAKPPECRECVLEIVRTILEENGIEVRRYFMDLGAHNHREGNYTPFQTDTLPRSGRGDVRYGYPARDLHETKR